MFRRGTVAEEGEVGALVEVGVLDEAADGVEEVLGEGEDIMAG